MELRKLLGRRFSDVKPWLIENDICYTLAELKDRKNTRMGDELRIIKIVEKEEPIIYVAYF